MPSRIFVTGLGLISGLGNNVQENLNSLLHLHSGIGPIRHIETSLKDELVVSEVLKTNDELIREAALTDGQACSRNTLLGIIAAKEAFLHARLNEHDNLRTGLISGTTVGGMDQCEKYYQDFLNNDSKNAFIDIYDCADSTEKIADYLGLKGFLTTISTACSSAANSIMFASRLMKAGKLDCAIAGGTESLTKFHLNGFNALKILDKQPCRPFDASRNGINLGEGAAYLILETEDANRQTGNQVICELAGYGNACEAFHQTASSPDGTGAYLAMKKALEMSGESPDSIDYINAHGTGTDNNDLSEGRAIERLFTGKIPFISSTKPLTGHMTSAAGSAEAIISILGLVHGIIWPNLNFSNPMPELKFQPVKEMIRGCELNVVMSNSFGFGGNDSSLIFKKYGIH
ncbi:MAG: beta-ketoacyl-[acyl-carrier-protein] synthase family protein [Bacteroidetes bacterium]|nr:beta-ketoacyl-[acyl-carrier-protein] synthase family protein [Bacteroidota bacterium]